MSACEPHQQLLWCLKNLTQNYSPKQSYNSHDCHGLYSGPTSIAYLFLHLSQTHPDIKVSGHSPIHWAEAYLAGKRPSQAVTADKNGVINEQLAYYAVRAALTQDLKDVEQLATRVRDQTLTLERGSD